MTVIMLAVRCHCREERTGCAEVFSVIGRITGGQRSAGSMSCNSATEIGRQEEQFLACIASREQ